MFEGGGFFIPRRKTSPVSFLFQLIDTPCPIGWNMVMAPGRLHSSTQQPQNQHSSGYRTMGGFFFCGFGIMTSLRHASTHMLQPLQISGLNSKARFGVGGFGAIYTFSLISIGLLIIFSVLKLFSKARSEPICSAEVCKIYFAFKRLIAER